MSWSMSWFLSLQLNFIEILKQFEYRKTRKWNKFWKPSDPQKGSCQIQLGCKELVDKSEKGFREVEKSQIECRHSQIQVTDLVVLPRSFATAASSSPSPPSPTSPPSLSPSAAPPAASSSRRHSPNPCLSLLWWTGPKWQIDTGQLLLLFQRL